MLDSFECQVIINQLRQGVIQVQPGLDWFHSLALSDRLSVLNSLGYSASQAGASRDDVAEAIVQAGLKPTKTSAVVLMENELKAGLSKLVHLPKEHAEDSFLLLLALFSIADNRRQNTACVNGCSHWWHQDLSDTSYLEELKICYDEGNL